MTEEACEIMYRIPSDLDLSPVVGESTTQLRVGQFDLQFAIGKVRFAVQSPVKLFREGGLIAEWDAGTWPGAAFFDMLNNPARRYEVIGDQHIVIEFESGLAMHLTDNSAQHECIQITIDHDVWII